MLISALIVMLLGFFIMSYSVDETDKNSSNKEAIVGLIIFAVGILIMTLYKILK